MQLKYLLLNILFVSSLLFMGCVDNEKKTKSPNGAESASNKVVTLYTTRYYTLDKELFDLFTTTYKVRVNVVLDKPENLIRRLKNEASNPQADLVLMGDLQDMYALKDASLLTTFSSDSIDNKTHLRNQDKQGMWVGLSKWAMGVGGAHKRVDPDVFSTYQDLAQPKFKGKIAVSSGKNESNQFLVASMLVTEGEMTTRNWLKGVISNLAQPPFDTDFDVVKAVGLGQADLSIINTSSLVQFQQSGVPENYKVGSEVGIKYPINTQNGTFYNLTSIGIVKGARNYDSALNLIVYLIQKEQQPKFCQSLHEYPVNVFAELDDFLLGIGGFREEAIEFDKVAKAIPQAIALMDEYGWK